MAKMVDLEPAATQVARLAAGVRDDQLDGPTPCPDYSVSVLLAHLLGLSEAFRDAAAKESAGSSPPDPARMTLDPKWRTALPTRLDELVAAWRAPTAWEGMTEAGGVALPGAVAGIVATDELVMHGWDLARATGQDFTCDPATTRVVYEFTLQAAAPGQEASRDGLFGPVVEIPDDAPLFDRALGNAGRDPAWTP